MNRLVCAGALVLAVAACTESTYSPELDSIGRLDDYTGVSSYDLCDAAAYFTYDSPKTGKETARKLLNEVLRRGDISKKDYNSALTGDLELGMDDLAATCAWGLPSEEEEYYISGGRKYTKWTYKYGEYGFEKDTVEFINDRVVALHAGG